MNRFFVISVVLCIVSMKNLQAQELTSPKMYNQLRELNQNIDVQAIKKFYLETRIHGTEDVAKIKGLKKEKKLIEERIQKIESKKLALEEEMTMKLDQRDRLLASIEERFPFSNSIFAQRQAVIEMQMDLRLLESLVFDIGLPTRKAEASKEGRLLLNDLSNWRNKENLVKKQLKWTLKGNDYHSKLMGRLKSVQTNIKRVALKLKKLEGSKTPQDSKKTQTSKTKIENF